MKVSTLLVLLIPTLAVGQRPRPAARIPHPEHVLYVANGSSDHPVSGTQAHSAVNSLAASPIPPGGPTQTPTGSPAAGPSAVPSGEQTTSQCVVACAGAQGDKLCSGAGKDAFAGCVVSACPKDATTIADAVWTAACVPEPPHPSNTTSLEPEPSSTASVSESQASESDSQTSAALSSTSDTTALPSSATVSPTASASEAAAAQSSPSPPQTIVSKPGPELWGGPSTMTSTVYVASSAAGSSSASASASKVRGVIPNVNGAGRAAPAAVGLVAVLAVAVGRV